MPTDGSTDAYAAEFREADARRELVGLDPLRVSPVTESFLPHGGDDLNFHLRRTTQQFTFEQLANQCIAVHSLLLPEIAQHLGTSPILTLGFVCLGGRPLFSFSSEHLRAWVRDGAPDFHGADIHCWITLPSLEILDYTLGAAIYKKTRDPRVRGAMVALHCSQLRGMSYHPIVLGEDVLPRLGLRRVRG